MNKHTSWICSLEAHYGLSSTFDIEYDPEEHGAVSHESSNLLWWLALAVWMSGQMNELSTVYYYKRTVEIPIYHPTRTNNICYLSVGLMDDMHSQWYAHIILQWLTRYLLWNNVSTLTKEHANIMRCGYTPNPMQISPVQFLTKFLQLSNLFRWSDVKN